MSEEPAYWQVVRAEREMGSRVSVILADGSEVVGTAVDVTRRDLVLDTGAPESEKVRLVDVRAVRRL